MYESSSCWTASSSLGIIILFNFRHSNRHAVTSHCAFNLHFPNDRYWKVCLGNKERSFCHFWDYIQVLHFRLFCWLWWLFHFSLERSWSWMVLWWFTRTSRTNTQKDFFFHHKELECKSRKSRDTWSNRQIWPWSTKWSRAKVNRVLPRECTDHSKHPLPTTQEKTLHMDIIRWSIPKSDWLCSLQLKMKKFYTVSKTKNWSWLWLRSWAPYCKIQA